MRFKLRADLRAALAAALFLPAWAACAREAGRPVESRTLRHDGRTRSFLLHLPPGREAGQRAPLLIVLHGGGGNAKIGRRMAAIDRLAEQEGFAAVYPDGTGRFRKRLLTWNAGDCCGYASDEDVDDVGFIGALIDHLVNKGLADPARVYAAGMSNGGMMAQRLACEVPGKIAAIADVSGALVFPECGPESPVSVLMIHGREDGHVPYEGGRGEKAIVDVSYPPARATLAHWARWDGCGKKPKIFREGITTRVSYPGCRDGAEVELLAVDGEGHTWPGGRSGRRRGPVPTSKVSASALMLDFFKRH